MGKGDKPWLRGAVTLGILGVVMAALIASPATAHFLHPSKAQVKKVAKKQATNVFNSMFPGAIAPIEAANQDKCADGAVLAYAFVDGNGVVSTTGYSTSGVSPQFNCKGGPIEVWNSGTGFYQVRIPGITTANPTQGVYQFTPADDHAATFVNIDTHTGDDYIEVDTFSHDGTADDSDFYVVAFK